MEEVKEPSHFFYAHDGHVLKDMNDLLNFLQVADDGTFEHHCNEEKNDFANWTDDTLKKHPLAKRMYKAKTRHELYEVVEKEVERLNKPSRKKSIISEIKEAFSG